MNITGSQSLIDEIAFKGDSFDVTLSPGGHFGISSADRRKIDVTPLTYVRVTGSCTASESSIVLTPTQSSGAITVTITISTETCEGSGEGGGGGGGAAGAVSVPSLPMAVVVPPEKKPPPPAIEVPPEEIPPPPYPLAVPGGILVPTPPLLIAPEIPTEEIPTPLPPIIEPVVEAIKKVAEDITETTKEVSKGIVEAVKSVVVEGNVEKAKIAVRGLRENPVVTNTIAKIIEPVLMVFAAIGAVILSLTAIQASAAVALNITTLLQSFGNFRFYLWGLVRFKKRNPWGKVIEKLTGKPVQAALVQVYDAEFKTLKDSQLTDKEGRFGALVGPGKYFIRVSKNGFQDKETEAVEIASPKQVLNLEIAIVLIQEAFGLEQLKKINFLDVLRRFLERINPVLLILGTIVGLISVIISPNLINYIVFSIYILLDILKIYFAVHFIKPFGKVLDELTLAPLPLSIIRIFDEEKNLLLATRAADDEGRFNFLLAPGKYFLTCVKADYAPYRSNPLILARAGLATLDIKLQKL